MRVVTRHGQHQQPLHLHLTRSNNNGKFSLSPNASPEPQLHQQQQQQPPPAAPRSMLTDGVAPVSARTVTGCDLATATDLPEQQQQQAQHSQQPQQLHQQHRHHHQQQQQHQQQHQQQQQQGPTILGDRFLLLGPAECSSLIRCVDVHTGQQLVAKALAGGDRGAEALLQAQMLMEGSGAASGLAGLVEAEPSASKRRRRYLLLEGHHGDLHAYVRARRRLREPEARRLFRQAARAVASCHRRGVVLRDLKLRKFVFADEARTRLRLESLEDAVLVDEEDDLLSDRRGCPAYVAPEVLRSGRAYSGRAADMWSLGVLLYTMLVGRYPFNDAEHASLFAKISRAHFQLPELLSGRARCLIRALLRRQPHERPLAADVLRHPWLARPLRPSASCPSSASPAPTPSAQAPQAAQAPHCLLLAGQQHHLDQLVPDSALHSAH